MKYAYRLGKAVMLPVACLPVAGLLMGVGFWLDPVGQGENLLLAHVMILAGSVLIDNMSLLFTLGVAVGMADEQDGTAALAGVGGNLPGSDPRCLSGYLYPGKVGQKSPAGYTVQLSPLCGWGTGGVCQLFRPGPGIGASAGGFGDRGFLSAAEVPGPGVGRSADAILSGLLHPSECGAVCAGGQRKSRWILSPHGL